MKKLVLECLFEIQGKEKEKSSDDLGINNAVTEMNNDHVARLQQDVIPHLLPHQKEAVDRELADRERVNNEIDEAKSSLNPYDPDSEIGYTSLDQQKLDNQASSANKVHNIITQIVGRVPEGYPEAMEARDTALERSREMSNKHIDNIRLEGDIENLIKEEEELENDLEDSSQEGSSSDNNSDGDNNPDNNSDGDSNSDNNNDGDNNQEGNNLGDNNQGNNNLGDNNQGDNNPGNDNQESNNQNKGSLIDDYADLSTEMPSYIDPED